MAGTRWMTMQEVLDELGVARSTWDGWRQAGTVPQGRRLPNGELRYERSEVEAWVESLEAA